MHPDTVALFVVGAPTSVREQAAQFEAMRPRLERSAIVFEVLRIMRRTPGLPVLLQPLQGLLIRAAIAILPAWAREILGLGPKWRLRGWEARLVRLMGAVGDRIVIAQAPPAQACVRMGLPANYLYARAG